jgi:hypothetical protein
MLTVVVVLNTLIALICFYVAWQIVKLRRKLAKIADTLTSAEKSTHSVLSRSPERISKGERGIHRLTERYQQLEPQWQKIQQVLTLIRLGQKVWQRQVWVGKPSRSRPSKLLKKRSVPR